MTAFSAKKDQQLFADLLPNIAFRHEVRIDGVHIWPLGSLIIGRRFKASNPIETPGPTKRRTRRRTFPRRTVLPAPMRHTAAATPRSKIERWIE